jgi:hypothetical protein
MLPTLGRGLLVAVPVGLGVAAGPAGLRPELAAELDALAPVPASDTPAAESPQSAVAAPTIDDPLPAAALLAGGAAGLVAVALAALVSLRRRR